MKNFDLQAYLKDLETVVNIDTGHYFEVGTNEVAEFFKKKYDELGFRTEIKYYQNNHATPFVTVTNTDCDHYDVLLVGHMDTVFAPGSAKERPFRIDEQGHGRGPGCIDCKGGCVLIYYLLKLMKEAGELNFTFCVAMNSDEELKSTYSRDYFEELAEKSDRCFLFEPGRANREFVSQRKGGNNYLIKCHGIAAHSGVCPEKGASAVLELSRWVDELYKRYFLLDEGTTINIGRFDGGADNGSVPDYAEFTISLRCMTNERLAEINKDILDIPNHPYDSRVTIESILLANRPCMTPDEKTFEIIHLMENVGRDLNAPIEMLCTGGGSDGNFIALHDCPTVDGCGPCGSLLHTVDEYLIIDSIEQRLDIMRETLLRIFAK